MEAESTPAVVAPVGHIVLVAPAVPAVPVVPGIPALPGMEEEEVP